MDSTKLENKWAQALKNNKSVKVEVKIRYAGENPRPTEFEVIYEIDGAVDKFVMKN